LEPSAVENLQVTHSVPLNQVPNAATPGAWAQYKTLVAKDLRREFRTKETLVSMGTYALIIIVIYALAATFAQPGANFTEMAGGLIWALVVFTSLLELGRTFAAEAENGCLDALLLAPVDRGVIFLAKATSNLVFLAVIEVVAVPLFLVFFSSVVTPAPTLPLIVAPLAAGSIGIAGIGTLLSTVTANARGSGVMLALLFVPLAFPLLYACVAATTAVFVGFDQATQSFATSMALAAGYDVIMILLSWLLYGFCVGQ
jgi:heme exporter protein B